MWLRGVPLVNFSTKSELKRYGYPKQAISINPFEMFSLADSKLYPKFDTQVPLNVFLNLSLKGS